MKRDIRAYIVDIMTSIEQIETFISGMTYPSFCGDIKTINAVIRSLEVMGEAAKKIPDTMRDAYPAVPWKNMSGMRDKLIHEYFGVDHRMVWAVCTEELPPLKPIIQAMLQDKKSQQGELL